MIRLLLLLATLAVATTDGLEDVRRLTPWPPTAGAAATVEAAADGDCRPTLTYAVNASAPTSVPFDGTSPPRAIIPPQPAATLLRWRVACASGTPKSPADGGWYGVLVGAPTELYGLPVLDWSTPSLAASTSDAGASNTDVVAFNGRGYAVARVARKGTTSRSWPKPKLKFRLASGQGGVSVADFAASTTPTATKPSTTFELDSLFWEPGENSYARQTIAWAAARALGVAAPAARHVVVRVNGAFYGLHALVESQDAAWLARVGLTDGGTLWKPNDGQWSNLRPDVPPNAWSTVWERQAGGGDVKTVAALASDLASRGSWRGQRAFALASGGDGLAATINYLAVYAVLLSQDRCTKNFGLYVSPSGGWRLLPGDSKSALGSDSGLGGEHATDYAIEVADQWSSPLYCDARHPQDIDASARAPWSRIVAAPLIGVAGGDVAGRRAATRAGRRLVAVADDAADATAPPAGCDAQPPTLSGSAGTFNYAVDAVLRCPPLRAAFLTRVATVAAALHTPRPGAPAGLLVSIANATTAAIQAAAMADDAVWHGGDPTRGAAQLTTEQIPRRAAALRDHYSVTTGTVAKLVPAVPADVEKIDVTLSAPSGAICLRAVDPAAAVDVSGWRLDGPLAVTLPPGAVVPPGGAVCAARDAAAAAAAGKREAGVVLALGGAGEGDGGQPRIVKRRGVLEVGGAGAAAAWAGGRRQGW